MMVVTSDFTTACFQGRVGRTAGNVDSEGATEPKPRGAYRDPSKGPDAGVAAISHEILVSLFTFPNVFGVREVSARQAPFAF